MQNEIVFAWHRNKVKIKKCNEVIQKLSCIWLGLTISCHKIFIFTFLAKYVRRIVINIIVYVFAGDGLSYHRSFSFSTKDKDNDNSLNSCAMLYGAWWYNSCHRSNLNGFYGSTEQAKGLIWSKWHGFNYSLKSTEMKIRRM